MKIAIITKEFQILRQEGDGSIIKFLIPAAIDLTSVTVKFWIGNYGQTPIISKELGTGVNVSGQHITIDFETIDTTNKSGNYRWELEINKFSDYGILTIGKGSFTIIKEYVK